MKTVYFLIFLLINISILFPKVLICTFAYNRPDFIEIQYLTFKKFLQEDFKLVVFNDAHKEDMQGEIKEICQKYTIDCIDIPQEIHTRPYLNRTQCLWNPTFIKYFEGSSHKSALIRNCNVCQYALDTLGFNHDDIVMLIDSDLFLVRKFSIIEFMQDHHAAAMLRLWDDVPNICPNSPKPPPGAPSFTYFWIGLIMLNMKSLPNRYALNLNTGIVESHFGPSWVDSAGYSYYFLTHTKDLITKTISRLAMSNIFCKNCKKDIGETCIHNTDTLCQLGFSDKLIPLLQEIPLDPDTGQIDRGAELFLSGTFFHYRSGSNHINYSHEYIEKKNKTFNNFIKNILEEQ